jgi:hypothetical protein
MSKKRKRLRARPAPDDLALVQEFVNTWNHPAKHDEIGGHRALRRWLERRGLLPAGVELDEADHQRAVAVRRALRWLMWMVYWRYERG